jgi:hypothetical protein
MSRLAKYLLVALSGITLFLAGYFVGTKHTSVPASVSHAYLPPFALPTQTSQSADRVHFASVLAQRVLDTSERRVHVELRGEDNEYLLISCPTSDTPGAKTIGAYVVKYQVKDGELKGLGFREVLSTFNGAKYWTYDVASNEWQRTTTQSIPW